MVLDDGNAESYDFWGTWLRMTDLCNVYQGLKDVSEALSAIDIFKERSRRGQLRVKAKDRAKTSGAASLPVEVWCNVQEKLREIARTSSHAHGEGSDCGLGSFTCDEIIESGGDRAHGHQMWCEPCFDPDNFYDYGEYEFSEIPENMLRFGTSGWPYDTSQRRRGYEYPQSLQQLAEKENCDCKACGVRPFHMMHQPGDDSKCPTKSALKFEGLILKPYGLRLASILTAKKRGYAELCGVTLSRFPDLVPKKDSTSKVGSSKSVRKSGMGKKAGTQAGSGNGDEMVKVTGKRKRDATDGSQSSARIPDSKMEELLQPFRKLLLDYPSLRVNEKTLETSKDDDDRDTSMSGPEVRQYGVPTESPFHLCRHHTPVKRGQLGPEGYVAKYDGCWDENFPSDLEHEVSDEYGSDEDGSNDEGW